MDEYISREAVLAHKWEVRVCDPNDPDPVSEVVSVSSILRIPAADVVKVRSAHWILHISDVYPADSTMECSLCNEEQLIGTSDSYCPNCGARMDGDGE